MKNFLILFLFLSVVFSQEKNQHGPFIVYNEEGVIIQKGNYKNGLEHGEFYNYSEEYNMKTFSIWNNGLKEKQTIVWTDGNSWEINIKNKKKNGPERYYDIIGNIISETNYVDGKEHGDSFSYYIGVDKIKSSIKFKGKYKNGKKVGIHTYYFGNGNIKEQTSYSNE